MIPARMLVPLYAAALFLGSLLLFGIQPMATKMVLPRLGGSPAVWNTAQVFFQALLLAGYLYAHLITRHLSMRVRMVTHLTLLAAALVFLPVSISADWQPPLKESPIPSLLWVLAVSIGVPFFAVAATAPLLQNWFSKTVHASASDPYFLYSASNLGGLVALLGYPFYFEPGFGLARQGWLWASGFGGLALLIAAAGIFLSRGLSPRTAVALPPVPPERTVAAVDWGLRLRWLLLAFAPSSLMLGVTLHISTDIAATPLLWVLPLALYIVTFVITFARAPALRHSWMLRLQPFAVALLLVFFDTHRLGFGFLLHLFAFFVIAMMCHGELAHSRPQVSRLTEFYIWLSLGGVLGGIFSGIAAPLLFESVLEYPLALVLACALRPGAVRGTSTERWRDVLLPVFVALVCLAIIQRLPIMTENNADAIRLLVAAAVGIGLYLFRQRAIRFTVAVALILIVFRIDLGPERVLAQARSFFGVHRVVSDSSGLFHLLTHGKTVHGAQFVDAFDSPEPLTYYTRGGPAGQTFKRLRESRPQAKIGAIGLGTGAISCFLGAEQSMIYFEIDPDVVALASNPDYFSYLTRCGKNVSIQYGDGRRLLESQGKGTFDMVVLDAFSSDAIPAHLLTREAVLLYLNRLKAEGILLIHISNRHLDLAPVVAAIMRSAGVASRVQRYEPTGATAQRAYHWASTWVIAAASRSRLSEFDASGKWQELPVNSDVRAWTDDYSNIIRAIDWKKLR